MGSSKGWQSVLADDDMRKRFMKESNFHAQWITTHIYDPLLPRRRSLELPGRIGQFPGRDFNP
jgi:hypothetical protein